MPLNEPNRFAVLWRRKWTVILTTVLVVAVTIGVAKTLTPVYSTTATLIVAQQGTTQTFETAQATEEAARSYAQVLSGLDFARTVARDVRHGATGQSISGATTISSVANTELITITAEDPSPSLAQSIADTYARVFVAYAPQLAPQTKANVSLADYATLPTSPVRPKPTLYGLAAVLVGLAAGLGLAFMRDRFDIRLRTVEEISDQIDVPVLATIPVRGRSNESAFSEPFRLLRSTLRFLDQDEEHKRFAITSWSEGEGKTTIAYQLALVIGSAGGQNVVVDADTHRAGLARLMDPATDPHQRPGLIEFVVGAVPAEDCLYPTSMPGVMFMPPGRTVTSISNLLESAGGSRALSSLGQSSDVVIVDCPPLAVSADASSLAAKVDGVVLVVDLSQATTVSLRKAVAQLRGVGAHIVGVVINRDRGATELDYYEYASRPAGSGSGLARLGGPVRNRGRRSPQPPAPRLTLSDADRAQDRGPDRDRGESGEGQRDEETSRLASDAKSAPRKPNGKPAAGRGSRRTRPN